MEQKTYLALIKHITNALQTIHSDYKKTGVIESLKFYDGQNILTYGYLRKLIEMGVLTNIGNSKKTSRYQWTGGDNPDYEELAIEVIDYKLQKSEMPEKEKRINILSEKTQIDAIISITIRLQKLGLSEQEIKEEVPKLLNAFST